MRRVALSGLVAAASLAGGVPAQATHPHFTSVGSPVPVTIPAALAAVHGKTHSRGTTHVVVRVQRDAAGRAVRFATTRGAVIAQGSDGGFTLRGTIGAGARAFAWGTARSGAVRVWTPALNRRRTLKSTTPPLACAATASASTAIAGPFAATIPPGARPGGHRIPTPAQASVFAGPLRIATARGVVLGRGSGVAQGGFALAGAVFAYGTLDGKPTLWTAKLAARSIALAHAAFVGCTPRAQPATAGTATVTLRSAGTDAGRFDLDLDGSARTAGAAIAVAPGNHSVSQTAHAGTSLADYATAIHCTEAHSASSVDAAGDGPLAVPVAAGDAWTCTLTNALTLAQTLAGLHVSSTPDTARRATRTIGSLGGTVTATGADGTVYALRVPPGAVAADTAISIAPTTLGGLDAIASATPYAVEFGPSGLQFAIPATLSITPPLIAPAAPDFVVTSDGTGVGIEPLATGPNGSLLISVEHFSVAAAIQATVNDAKALAARAAAANGPAYRQLSNEIAGLPGTSSAIAVQMMVIFSGTVAPDIEHGGDDLAHFLIAERELSDWNGMFILNPGELEGLASGDPTAPTLRAVRSRAIARFEAKAEGLLSSFEQPACSATVTGLTDWVAVPTTINAELSQTFGAQLPAVGFCIAGVAQPSGFPASIDSSQRLIDVTLRGGITAPAGTPGATGTDQSGLAFFPQPTVYELTATGATFTGSGSALDVTKSDGQLAFELDRGADEPSRAPHAVVSGTAVVGGDWAQLAALVSSDTTIPVHLDAGPPHALHIAFRSPPTDTILAPGETTTLCVDVSDENSTLIAQLAVNWALDGPGSLASNTTTTDSLGKACVDYHHPAGVVAQGDTATITASASHNGVDGHQSTTLTPRWASIALQTRTASQQSFSPSTNTTVPIVAGDDVTLRATIMVPGATASAAPVPADGDIAQIDVESGVGTISDGTDPPNTILLPILDSSGETEVTWDAGGPAAQTTLRVSFPSPGLGLAGVAATVTLVPQTGIAVTPGSVAVDPGGQQQFTATVVGPANEAVTWTATGGTIDADGDYTAGTTPGHFAVTATSVADPTASDTASVVVRGPGVVIQTTLSQSISASVNSDNDLICLNQEFTPPDPDAPATFGMTLPCAADGTPNAGGSDSGTGTASLAYHQTSAGGLLTAAHAALSGNASIVCNCPNGGSVQADERTQYDLEFETEGPTAMTITASTARAGDSTSQVAVGECTPNPVVNVQNGANIAQTIILPAGHCQLFVSVNVEAETGFHNFPTFNPSSGSATVDVSFAAP